MRRKMISLIAALALCLGLLPGTAWAAGDSTVKIGAVALESGKQYVASETSGVEEKPSDTPADTPYLDYSGGTLTVHGAFAVNATLAVNSDLTITGGEGSSLNVTAASDSAVTLGNSALTLDGGVNVDFTTTAGYYATVQKEGFNSEGTFQTTDNYSGNIVIKHSDVRLDVQSSSSITITGSIYSTKSVVLESEGAVNITSAYNHSLGSSPLSIKGANVKLIMNGTRAPVFAGSSLNIEAAGDVLITNKSESEPESTSPAIQGAAVISAGGNVTISSDDVPIWALGSGNDLTVKNAQTVSITGASSKSSNFFAVPVTFENCGNVTVTDTGSGKLMSYGVTVTSAKPWIAKIGGSTVTMPSGSWNYGGATTDAQNQHGLRVDSGGTTPTCWKAGEGWIYYEPAADESSPAELTLDNATYEGIIMASKPNGLTVTAKGNNQIGTIKSDGSGSVTVKTKGGGTLNTIVEQWDRANSKTSNTVYGKVELPVTALGQGSDLGGQQVSLTITQGAEATIPSNAGLTIFDTTCLTNNGSIVNNGTVTLKGAAAENVTSETIKGLNLTGTGTVSVIKKVEGGSEVTETYTNSGVKFLDPAEELDLSNADTEDTSNWDAQGYKWTNVEKDADGNITSGTLTLAPGFNATSGTLPDAAVTIVTEGESRIDTLTPPGGPSNAHADKLKLTFSGTSELTITERVEISGGAGNSITVDAGAKVTANNGISIGASGGIDSTITVNGTLTTAQGMGTSAIYCGKVEIGDTGVLKVSGTNGVQLNGMTDDFNNLFTVAGNGRFTADCSTYNIRVNFTDANKLPKDENGNPDAKEVINLSPEYMPDDCEPRMNNNPKVIDLFRISTNAVYTGPLTIHKNHTWSSDWTDGGGDTHHHACIYHEHMDIFTDCLIIVHRQNLKYSIFLPELFV